jgi:hypothetical protein
MADDFKKFISQASIPDGIFHKYPTTLLYIKPKQLRNVVKQIN